MRGDQRYDSPAHLSCHEGTLRKGKTSRLLRRALPKITGAVLFLTVAVSPNLASAEDARSTTEDTCLSYRETALYIPGLAEIGAEYLALELPDEHAHNEMSREVLGLIPTDTDYLSNPMYLTYLGYGLIRIENYFGGIGVLEAAGIALNMHDLCEAEMLNSLIAAGRIQAADALEKKFRPRVTSVDGETNYMQMFRSTNWVSSHYSNTHEAQITDFRFAYCKLAILTDTLSYDLSDERFTECRKNND